MAITDLTGTKWRFNDVCSYLEGDTHIFHLNYVSSYDSTERTALRTPYLYRNTTQVATILLENASSGVYYTTSDFGYTSTSLSGGEGWYRLVDGAYPKQDTPPTITILGGDDVSNSDLISWFQNNATQIIEPTNTFSFGNLPIANMYFGTRQVKKVYLGNTLVWEKEETANLISFTIAGTTYQAEEGMTWAEWVASEYNTNGYILDNSKICTANEPYMVMGIVPSDVILANTTYRHTSNVSGGGAD